jgi:hypothetical protein
VAGLYLRRPAVAEHEAEAVAVAEHEALAEPHG